MNQVPHEYDFSMFWELSFPIIFEQNNAKTIMTWRIVKWFCYFGMLTLYGCLIYFIFLAFREYTNDFERKMVIASSILFSLVWLWIFWWLKNSIQLFKPEWWEKVLLTENTIIINNISLKLSEIICVNISETVGLVYYWNPLLSISIKHCDKYEGIEEFFCQNFQDSSRYFAKKWEEEIMQILQEKDNASPNTGDSLETYKKIMSIFSQENRVNSYLFNLLPLWFIFTNRDTILIGIPLIILAQIIFIFKYRLYRLSFIHPVYWGVLWWLVIYYLESSLFNFYIGLGAILIEALLWTSIIIILFILIKSKPKIWYWWLLLYVSLWALILALNDVLLIYQTPTMDSYILTGKEFIQKKKGSDKYYFLGESEKIGIVQDNVGHKIYDKYEIGDTIPVKIYRSKIGFNLYRY